MTVRIQLDAVRKEFGTGEGRIIAADGISLEIAPGSAVALTGASGSGKSTLLHMIGAVERADGGRIVVGEDEVTALGRRELARYRRGIGFVFQRFHLLPALTALDNVIAPVLPRKVDFDRAARARELLDAVGLAGREKALPSQLSGGQQQRVAIARALIGRPRLLLADEPTGALDSATGEQITALLHALSAEYGLTTLIATHEAAVAAECDRTVSLKDGRIVSDSAQTGSGQDNSQAASVSSL
ncbi:ABC transporter ATP-binding protein [Streptomyces sp. NBC_01465]|uniref:ABC transporter ATP-binding protein n=1 Tax=Streptomyces sp. NBC_01465 TaxID=2903878 RepID=UPI002E367B0A|nr:ABC transporter ATP-binding protein [Streptomyces sp. NBC_01465]